MQIGVKLAAGGGAVATTVDPLDEELYLQATRVPEPMLLVGNTTVGPMLDAEEAGQQERQQLISMKLKIMPMLALHLTGWLGQMGHAFTKPQLCA